MLEGLVERLQEFDLAVFLSRNAVDYGLACVLARRARPQPLRLAALGPGARGAPEAGRPQVAAPVIEAARSAPRADKAKAGAGPRPGAGGPR